MINYIGSGVMLNLIAPVGGVVAGRGYLIDALFVVAAGSSAAGLPFLGVAEGMFDLSKVSAETWTAGARVYWDDGVGKVTTDADGGANLEIGVAAMAAVGGSVLGRVRLNGQALAAAGASPSGGGLTVWNDADTYAEDDLVLHNGGTWQAAGSVAADSEPSSGNTDWTLVSDTATDVVDLTGAQIAVLSSDPPELLAGRPGYILRFVSIASQTTPGTIPSFTNNHISIAYTGTVIALTDGQTIVSNGEEPTFSQENYVVNNGSNPGEGFLLEDVVGVGLSVFEGSDDPNGAILTSEIGDGGLGYAPGDTFNIAGGQLGTGVVTTIGALGVVTGFTITAVGYDYNVADGKPTNADSPSAGMGLTIDVLTITPPNGSARLWITYQMFPVVT